MICFVGLFAAIEDSPTQFEDEGSAFCTSSACPSSGVQHHSTPIDAVVRETVLGDAAASPEPSAILSISLSSEVGGFETDFSRRQACGIGAQQAPSSRFWRPSWPKAVFIFEGGPEGMWLDEYGILLF
jgi:hypothetical protein